MRKIALILASTMLLAACDGAPRQQGEVKQTQAQKAEEAANSIQFSGNAEIDNIKRRLELTSNPGQIGFVLLMNQMGQPVAYYGVKGKITSSSKRLTSPEQKIRVDSGQYDAEELGDAPSDEGTYGSSDPYVYFWDMEGNYHQWNGLYLYSDKPIRTSVAPIVISVTK